MLHVVLQFLSAARTGGAWLLALGLLLGGCAGQPRWGPAWPQPLGAELARAAGAAARDPATWSPLLVAGVLSAGELDDNLSDWAARHQPLFGSSAASASDDLRSAATAAYVLTALAAPSPGLPEKAGGLAVGFATLSLTHGATEGIKRSTGRTRPDRTDDRSFPSGHTSTASSAATLARRNLAYLDLAPWLDRGLRAGLHGIAAGTGWARVEAEKHHVSDVLAGYALGNFVAAFMHHAFMTAPVDVEVTFRAFGDGGVLTLVVPLAR